MKVKRKANVVTITIEPADCPPGYTTEMFADAIAEGIKAGGQILNLGDSLTDENYQEVVGRSIDDFEERWEIT